MSLRRMQGLQLRSFTTRIVNFLSPCDLDPWAAFHYKTAQLTL